MAGKNKHIAIGIIIIVVGFLLLLNNQRVLYLDSQFCWGAAFVILGLIFLNVFIRNKTQRGPLMLGVFLTIIGLIAIFDSFNYFSDDVLGVFILWFVAAIFISIFVRNNKQWWSIIPGGMFFIFGMLVLLSLFNIINSELLWFVFLAGLSLIFWFLYLTLQRHLI